MFLQIASYGAGVLVFFALIVVVAGASGRLSLVVVAHLVVTASVIGLDVSRVKTAIADGQQMRNDRLVQSVKNMLAGAAVQDTDVGIYLIDAGLTAELRELERIVEEIRHGNMTEDAGVSKLQATVWVFDEESGPDFDGVFVIGMFMRILIVNACLIPCGIVAHVLRVRMIQPS